MPIPKFRSRVFLAAIALLISVNAEARQWYNLNIIVYNNATNTGIPGALVTINQDFGNGTSRTADGNGFTNFGVTEAQIGYTVSAAGYAFTVTDSRYVSDHTTIYVGLTPNSAVGGRYVLTGSGASLVCAFDPTQNGPNQCDPTVPPQIEAPAPPNGESTWNEVLPDQLGSYNSYVSSFSAAGIATCRAIERPGNVGKITGQTTTAPTWDPQDQQWYPAGMFQWGITMHNLLDNFGYWWVQVYANGVKRDEKRALQRQPHGRLQAHMAPPGTDIYILAYHLYMKWYWAPVRLPDGRWTIRGFYAPVLAWGSMNCIMPFPGQ